jgi:hypothetical protein
MPVGLLDNELLTNAFKYAFVGREGGTLTVRCLHEKEDAYRIVIADNGVVLPANTTWPVSGKLGGLILKSLEEKRTPITPLRRLLFFLSVQGFAGLVLAIGKAPPRVRDMEQHDPLSFARGARRDLDASPTMI